MAIREPGNAAMTEMVDVKPYIVTALYKSEKDLPRFLDSLQLQDIDNWQLYAVDNASPDRSVDLVTGRADPRIVVLRNPINIGFARAINRGLQAAAAAGATFFIVINNDTEFRSDFLRRLLAAQRELNAGVVAPRVMRREHPEKCWYAGGHLDDGWLFSSVHYTKFDPFGDPTPIFVDFAPGCCLGIDRKVLEKVGLFDERFFVYWEDTDFCIRLKALGLSILYLPELSILHAGGASSGGEFSTAYSRLYYRSYMQFMRKHFGYRRALRTMLRLVLREIEQRKLSSTLPVMTMALLRGMTALQLPRTRGNPCL